MTHQGKIFLTAEWCALAMLNFRVEPAVLAPLVPAGVELDSWNGQTYMSVVGFLFLRARVLGLSIPFHRRFEEVNLRYYVRRKTTEGWRRGVVFVKELVPRAAIAWTANAFYGERYSATQMRHTFASDGRSRKLRYEWGVTRPDAGSVELVTDEEPAPVTGASHTQFITEHDWGYARKCSGATLEYQVERTPWLVSRARAAILTCDARFLYGERLARFLPARPDSAFLAEGSSVIVRRGSLLPAER